MHIFTSVGLVYRSVPDINTGINNGIKYHTSLVSKNLIFPPIPLYAHIKFLFFLSNTIPV